MTKYDFFIAGRWRNREEIKKVLDAVRAMGKSAYCFIENPFDGDGIVFKTDSDADPEGMMAKYESIEDFYNNKTARKIFDADLQGIKDSEKFLLVLPAGKSGHVEAGLAYGLGKQCIAIGPAEQNESLYFIFDKLHSSLEDFVKEAM